MNMERGEERREGGREENNSSALLVAGVEMSLESALVSKLRPYGTARITMFTYFRKTCERPYLQS